MKGLVEKIGLHGGFHIHNAEGIADNTRSVERTGKRTI